MLKAKELFSRVFSSDNENTESVSLPVLKLMFYPFAAVIDNFKPLFVISAIYAVLLTLMSYVFGFSFFCVYGGGADFTFCSGSNFWYFAYMLSKIFVISFFVVKVYNTIFHQEPLLKLNPSKTGLKVFAVLCCFMILLIAPVVSFFILAIRVPNPDWVVEISFFAVVSVGFIVPFCGIRFFSVLSFVLDNEELPPLAKIWNITKGNTLKIILALFLLLVVTIVLTSSFFQGVRSEENSIYLSIMSEYLYNILSLAFVWLYISHCVIQKKILFKGEEL